jgi:hypothetical protein
MPRACHLGAQHHHNAVAHDRGGTGNDANGSHTMRGVTMYVQEYLAKDRQRERLREALEDRTAYQAAELKKVERRRLRAERELLSAWQRVDQLRSMLEAS